MKTKLTAEEQEKAKILHASGKTIYSVAQTLGRSPHTLKKFLREPAIAKEVNIQKSELATMFDAITHRTLAGVTDEDIRKSSLLQKMTAAGISIDKALLLRNELPPVLNLNVLFDFAEQLRNRRDETPLPHPQLPALSPAIPSSPKGQP
jgi:hypothetical protein